VILFVKPDLFRIWDHIFQLQIQLKNLKPVQTTELPSVLSPCRVGETSRKMHTSQTSNFPMAKQFSVSLMVMAAKKLPYMFKRNLLKLSKNLQSTKVEITRKPLRNVSSRWTRWWTPKSQKIRLQTIRNQLVVQLVWHWSQKTHLFVPTQETVDVFWPEVLQHLRCPKITSQTIRRSLEE
jgi:hypothetical protein